MVKNLIILSVFVLLPFWHADALEALPAPSQQYQKANSLLASSRFREALSLYQKLLASPSHHIPVGDIRTRIADSYFGLGRFQDALDSYRAALSDRKESAKPETQYWIGFCCFLLGRDAEAVSEFLKIPRLYPDSGMWIGTAYYWAGRASQRLGRADEAAAYYKKAGGNGRSSQGRFALKKAEAVNGASTNKQARNPK